MAATATAATLCVCVLCAYRLLGVGGIGMEIFFSVVWFCFGSDSLWMYRSASMMMLFVRFPSNSSDQILMEAIFVQYVDMNQTADDILYSYLY